MNIPSLSPQAPNSLVKSVCTRGCGYENFRFCAYHVMALFYDVSVLRSGSEREGEILRFLFRNEDLFWSLFRHFTSHGSMGFETPKACAWNECESIEF